MVFTPKMIRRTEHPAHMTEKRSAYKIFFGKRHGEKSTWGNLGVYKRIVLK
jgi:hypothetical protein